MSTPHLAISAGVIAVIIAGIILFCRRDSRGHCPRIRSYLIAQLRDGTTWRGFTLVGTAAGWRLAPEHAEAIVWGGVLLAGLLGVVWPPDTK